MKENGQGLTEYLIILILVAVVVVCALMAFGPYIEAYFEEADALLYKQGTYSAKYIYIDVENNVDQVLYLQNIPLDDKLTCPEETVHNDIVFQLAPDTCVVR